MKTVVIVTLLFTSAALMPRPSQAQTEMHLHLNDGSVLSFGIDSVQSIRFRGDTDNVGQYTFHFYPETVWSNEPFALGIEPYAFPVGPADSVIFAPDTLAETAFTAFVTYYDFPELRRLQYHLAWIDSIVVASRFGQLDTNSDVLPFTRVFDTNGATGDFYFSIWVGDRIYNSPPLHFFQLDSSLHISMDSSFFPLSMPPMCVDFTNNFILGTGFSGYLLEFDIATGSRKILDSSALFSNAIYFPSTNNIIYYSYGSYSSTNLTPLDAGFYFWDRSSGNRIFMLHYIANRIGPTRTVNGFDISPDGKKLLYASASENSEPSIAELDLSTNIVDTLPISFDSTQFGIRPNLWLRFNHDGSKILYCNYPSDAFPSGQPGNYSEIGIIDRITLKKQILHTDPVNIFLGISLFPEWSPDDKMIVYGNTRLADDGTVGTSYQTCILTKIPQQ